MCDTAARTSSDVCTKLSATRSTPRLQAEPQVGHILRRERRRGQRNARRVDALVLAEQGAVHHHRPQLAWRAPGHPQLDSAVVQQQPVARLRRTNQFGDMA